MFNYYFERKNDKVSTFNIVHVPNFEISASLPSKFNMRRRRLLEEMR